MPPHIVLALADDLGYNGVGWRNPTLHTPVLDSLARESLLLESFYTESICAPARASLLTGRFAYKLLASATNLLDFDREEATSIRYTLLPQHMQRLGYATHLVGKWHQGFYAPAFLPTRRGFDTFFGFLGGCSDPLTQAQCNHRCGGRGRSRRPIVDLWRNDRPATGENGTTCNAVAFAREATTLISRHARETPTSPFFLLLALQDPHSPYQVDERYLSRFRSAAYSPLQAKWSAIVWRLDETVGAVVQALRSTGMWQTCLFVFASDNGSPVGGWHPAGSNAPLRGGKDSLWEGGVRTMALVGGGWLPDAQRGKTHHGLASIVDWHATFCAVATSGSTSLSAGGCPEDAGPSPVDSLDLSGWLRGDRPKSPRTLIVHGHRRRHSYPPWSRRAFAGALRVGDFKLMVGPQHQSSWFGQFAPNASYWDELPVLATPPAGGLEGGVEGKVSRRRALRRLQRGPAAFAAAACIYAPCLFNLAADPTEHTDLALAEPAKLAELLGLFGELKRELHPPSDGPPRTHTEFCAAVAAHAGFVAPWRESPVHDWNASWSSWNATRGMCGSGSSAIPC